MDYRPGTCSACKASFRIPSSFTANRAKCSKCGGVVEIGPVTSDSAAPASSSSVPPVPAKAVSAPVASAAAKLAASPEPTPAGAKPVPAKTPPAIPPSVKPAATAKPAAPVKPAAAPVKPAAAKPAAAAARPASSVSRPMAAKTATPPKREVEEERSSSERRARGAATKRGSNPMLMVGAGVVLVVIGIGVWYAYGKTQERKVEAAARAEAKKAERIAKDEEESRKLAEQSAAEEQKAAEEKAQKDAQLAAQREEDQRKKDEAAAAKKAEAVKAADAPVVGFDLSTIPDFGPYEGTSPEQWTELQELAKTFVDPAAGARATRAGIKLEETPKLAFPAILNEFKKLNLEDEDGYRSADTTQKLLERICKGHNFGWKYRTEKDWLAYDQKAIKKWCDTWTRASTDEAYWKQITKEGATPKEGDEPAAPAPQKPDDF